MTGQRLRIPGEELPEVVEALDFIEQIHTEPLHRVPVGARVAVLGCGNTAIDAATQARRLGAAEVVVIYRRGERDMSAYGFEYDLAKQEGASFLFHHALVEVHDPEYCGKISAKTHQMNLDYNSFEGFEIEGRPHVVTVRGKVAARDRKFVGDIGRGKFLQREPNHF